MYVHIVRFGVKEIFVIGHILSSAPTLRTMELAFPLCDGKHYNVFMKKLLALRISSPDSSLFILKNDDEQCNECFFWS